MATNNTNREYTFDYANNTIILTKKFSKEANEFNSAAYKTLKQLIKDFPTYTIKVKEIKKKENKRSYKGLTISEMKRFVEKIGKKELEEFNNVKTIAESRSFSSYGTIKKWFLDKYEDAYNDELKVEKGEVTRGQDLSEGIEDIENKKCA